MFCAVSALLRELTEEEAIAHACVSKSRYHEVKKHLLEIIVLPPRTGIGKKSKKRCWSLRENDRYDIICGVNGKVYFSTHFYGVIVCKISCMPPFLAIMFSSKRPINAKSAYNVIFGIVSGVKISRKQHDVALFVANYRTSTTLFVANYHTLATLFVAKYLISFPTSMSKNRLFASL